MKLKHFNYRQISALIRKDVLVRVRQRWMTILQYLWPCAIFMSLYILRLRFQAHQITDCQFPTRQLPGSNELLPFFQSYICTIENICSDVKDYEEITSWQKAPITPVLNIVQTFLNERDLYKAVVELPKSMEFISFVTKLATNSKFKYIESNADYLVRNFPEIKKKIGNFFDVNKLFSNDRIFSKLGNVLCGNPFPRSDNIRFVDDILYSHDSNGPDKDELDVMPTQYCKQLYLDVTNTNNGKITWKLLKPIIQGKILFGPYNDETTEIVRFANKTFEDMSRLREFFRSLETSITMLKENEKFREKFESLISLAKSPFVQALLGGSIDLETIEMVLNSIVNDTQVADIIHTVGNIFDCFSTDRFVPVQTEKELEDKAYELAKKKLFYAGIYFTSDKNSNETSYKLRMEVDNTPVTIENRNRFWFPGAEGNFELEMRYHRGFIEIQNSIDIAIIKSKKKKQFETMKEESSEDLDFSELTFDDDMLEVTTQHLQKSSKEKSGEPEANFRFDDFGKDFGNFDDDDFTDNEATSTSTSIETTQPEINYGDIFKSLQSNLNISSSGAHKFSDNDNDDFWKFDDEDETTTKTVVSEEKLTQLSRKKRQEFSGILGLLGFGGDVGKGNVEVKYEVDDVAFYTKQFPYPEFKKDDFIKGLYLAQAVQMSFFFALIIHISSAVRHKIWFKESGNLALMRTMGMRESSELISWIITTFVELAIVFLVALVILYSGGIMQYANQLLIYLYLLIFGLSVISFCFMSSTFFSTASIGSVSTVILFLMTFLPYIIIISLGTVMNVFGKIVTSLSLSTAFCYAWHYILRTELQERSLTFANAFSGSFAENDFKFGILMIVFDMALYAIIGSLYQKYSKDEYTFYKVGRRNIDKTLGAQMTKVTKIYDGCDPNKPAVDDVSISFKRDEILCLLGRNGAGKSTIIKMLSGQLHPSFGEVDLPLDYDLITGFRNHQEQIGLCSQSNVLIPNLTAKEHLQLYAKIKLTKNFSLEVRRVMNNMKLGKFKDYRVSELSGGYKRRLCIAIAFIGSPNLVILDEPCGSVDTHARKTIWELIESLRKGRAVILATHDLDEAQHLGDNILIMKDGRIALQSTTNDLQKELTKNFTININLKASTLIDQEAADEVRNIIMEHTKVHPATISVNDCTFSATVCYYDNDNKLIDHSNMYRALEKLQVENKILAFNVISKTLDDLFKSVQDEDIPINDSNYINNNNMEIIDMRKIANGLQNNCEKSKKQKKEEMKTLEIVMNLFWKRFCHFRRNFRLMICILVLPVVFEIFAMAFMKIRPPGDYDNMVEFNRSMYPSATEFYSNENPSEFGDRIYQDLESSCSTNVDCKIFNTSKESFNWLLDTHEQYILRRYGGISINQSKSIVLYNNKGYHSMPLYLNILNSAILRNELNDSSYNIRTFNSPLKLNEEELSISSILQQVADSGISLILLISFSLVLSGASVYIVNERVSGEKLQQKLCGVNFQTYWGVAFIWDFTIYSLALAVAVIVFKIFNIPIYVERENLAGIVLLLFFFGFASIPAVHLFEKLFSEASFANMSIFCINVIIALTTLTTIIMFDVLGETDEHVRTRDFLNRLFLVFPQHALADGLIEICRNFIMSKIFIRYYINTYKSPLTSDLLKPHFTALIILGFVFIILNYIVENGVMWRIFKRTSKNGNQLQKVVTIQNSLLKDGKFSNDYAIDTAIRVKNLSKIYSGSNYAVNNVSFTVNNGECYGLLGANGAGKSSIFSILSGDTKQFSGLIEFSNSAQNKYCVSYCPQTNALDLLLTVEEMIKFYGKLRNVKDLKQLIRSTLDNFHLKAYRNVLVKNLSGGNKRKLNVACASFGDTNVVLMDEPTSDMDPLTRNLVYKTVRELNDNNCSVILTSHSVSEIEKICHNIGILVDGSMVATGTAEKLRKHFGNRYVVTMLSDIPLDVHFENDLRKTFRSMKNLTSYHYSAQFIIQVRDYENVDHCHMNFSELIDLLNAFTSVKGLKYTISECMLDQVYDSIIKKGLNGIDNNGFVQTENQMT